MTPKRRKTIGQLIATQLDIFRAMKLTPNDWMKLRAKVGNAEDWKQLTEAFLPELSTADLFLRALQIDEAPVPEFTEEVGALLPGIVLGQARRFASLRPSESQKDSFLAMLPNEDQKIQARLFRRGARRSYLASRGLP